MGPHYSGPASRVFWERINSLPRDETVSAIYLLACTLQDLEGRVLQLLESASPPASGTTGIVLTPITQASSSPP